LFRPDDEFPEVSTASELMNVVAPGKDPATLRFAKLPPGSYAIAVYQDKNDDGVLNRARVGYPLERYGFSNNARRTLGPPSFDAAAFSVDNQEVVQEITVK
jgi:uncharacterized protein (DUF2141 family)